MDNGLKGSRIRVNAVNPGPIETAGLNNLVACAGAAKQRLKMLFNSVPLDKLDTSNEFAKAMVFLASDDSSCIAGTELFVNDGLAQVQAVNGEGAQYQHVRTTRKIFIPCITDDIEDSDDATHISPHNALLRRFCRTGFCGAAPVKGARKGNALASISPYRTKGDNP